MKTFLVLLFALGIVFRSAGQTPVNYVPNPSFELLDSCPDAQGQVDRLKQWYNPTYGTPDFFHDCANPSWYGVPVNFAGYQLGKSGIGYVGLGSGVTGNQREYIGVKLKADLIADSTYCIKAWVSRAESFKYAIGCIGFYFSPTKLHMYAQLGFDSNIEVMPQYFNPVTNYITDTAGWMLIEGSFVAQGGERFLTIGNFFSDSATQYLLVNPDAPPWISVGAYVYIDDVSVTACSVTAVNSIPHQAALKLYPNPASDHVLLEFSGKGLANALVEVRDVLGRIVLEQRLAYGNNTLSTTGWPAGTYLVQVTDENGLVCHQNLVISRP